MSESSTTEDDLYVFHSRLRLSQATLAGAFIFLLLGVPAFGFFLYLIVTGYTDDRSLLFSFGTISLVGVGAFLISKWAKKSMTTNFPELWADYQSKSRSSKKTSADA